MNTTERDEVRDYLAELRHELADLPAAEIEDVVLDVTPQLTEIADAGESITERLGTPAEYAAELRGAAGLSAVEPKQDVLGARFAAWTLAAGTVAAGYGGFLHELLLSNDTRYVLPVFGVVLAASWFVVGRFGRAVPEVAALPEVRLLLGELRPRTDGLRRVWDYLVSLQPGWFLLRAALVGFGAFLVFQSRGLYPGGPELVGLLVAVLAIVAGYRSRVDRRWLWLSAPIGAWAIGVAVGLLTHLP
jgi:HAAS domain-containing protein